MTETLEDKLAKIPARGKPEFRYCVGDGVQIARSHLVRDLRGDLHYDRELLVRVITATS